MPHIHIVKTKDDEGKDFEAGGGFQIVINSPPAGSTLHTPIRVGGQFKNTGGVAPSNVIMQLGSLSLNEYLSPDPQTQQSSATTWSATFSFVDPSNDWVFGIQATLGTITSGVSSGFTVT
jgi:hypothetical protein